MVDKSIQKAIDKSKPLIGLEGSLRAIALPSSKQEEVTDKTCYPPPIGCIDKKYNAFLKVIYGMEKFFDYDVSVHEIEVLRLLTEEVLDKGLHPSVCGYIDSFSVPLPLFNRITPKEYMEKPGLLPDVKVLVTECVPMAFDSFDEWNPKEVDYYHLIFQVLSLVHLWQVKFKLIHNDLHTSNVFIARLATPTTMSFSIKNVGTFCLENVRYVAKVTDFEFSIVKSPPKKYASMRLDSNQMTWDKPEEVCPIFSKTYDVYFFLRDCLSLDGLPEDLRSYIVEVFSSLSYPEEEDLVEEEEGDQEEEESQEDEDTTNDDMVTEEDDDEEEEDTIEDAEDFLPARLHCDFINYYDKNAPTASQVLRSKLFERFKSTSRVNNQHQKYRF